MQTSHSKTASPFSAAQKQRAIDVLILDDERYDRHRLARMCSGLNFPCAVHNAKSLKEFEEHLDEEDFGLILLDYALPDGTGLDALHLMQLNARNLNTPSLMISGHAKEDVAAQAEAAGCAGYLSKDGLSSDDFAKAVNGALTPLSPVRVTHKDQFSTQEVEQLIARATARSAQDIKPMVSRLMRQMRNLRASQTIHDVGAFQTIEQDCLDLWTHLVELEKADRAGSLTNLIDPQMSATVGALTAKSSKPPSPFKSRRH